MDGSDSGVHSYATNVVKYFNCLGEILKQLTHMKIQCRFECSQLCRSQVDTHKLRIFQTYAERRVIHTHPDPATLQALSSFARNACSRLLSSIPLCLFTATSRDTVVQHYDKDVVWNEVGKNMPSLLSTFLPSTRLSPVSFIV